jgi:hypothetical protein
LGNSPLPFWTISARCPIVPRQSLRARFARRACFTWRGWCAHRRSSRFPFLKEIFIKCVIVPKNVNLPTSPSAPTFPGNPGGPGGPGGPGCPEICQMFSNIHKMPSIPLLPGLPGGPGRPGAPGCPLGPCLPGGPGGHGLHGGISTSSQMMGGRPGLP